MTDQETLAPRAEGRASNQHVFVDVYANSVGGSTHWSHEWRWGEHGASEGNGTIKIPQRKPDEPGTTMHFKLHDRTHPKLGFQYDQNQGSAMWVKRDSCPPADARSDDAQIPSDQMETAPKLLTAFNVNSEKCTLHYRLWFKDQNGNPGSYDPDITNGGKSFV